MAAANFKAFLASVLDELSEFKSSAGGSDKISLEDALAIFAYNSVTVRLRLLDRIFVVHARQCLGRTLHTLVTSVLMTCSGYRGKTCQLGMCCSLLPQLLRLLGHLLRTLSSASGR